MLTAISKLIRYKDRIPQRLIHLKVNTEGDPMLHVFTAKLKYTFLYGFSRLQCKILTTDSKNPKKSVSNNIKLL